MFTPTMEWEMIISNKHYITIIGFLLIFKFFSCFACDKLSCLLTFKVNQNYSFIFIWRGYFFNQFWWVSLWMRSINEKINKKFIFNWCFIKAYANSNLLYSYQQKKKKFFWNVKKKYIENEHMENYSIKNLKLRIHIHKYQLLL